MPEWVVGPWAVGRGSWDVLSGPPDSEPLPRGGWRGRRSKGRSRYDKAGRWGPCSRRCCGRGCGEDGRLLRFCWKGVGGVRWGLLLEVSHDHVVSGRWGRLGSGCRRCCRGGGCWGRCGRRGEPHLGHSVGVRRARKVNVVAAKSLISSGCRRTRMGFPSSTARKCRPRGITVTQWGGEERWQRMAVRR